jgi:hypothetical protein
MNGAEKDSERNSKAVIAVAAVVSREFAFSLFSFNLPAQSLSKPSIVQLWIKKKKLTACVRAF